VQPRKGVKPRLSSLSHLLALPARTSTGNILCALSDFDDGLFFRMDPVVGMAVEGGEGDCSHHDPHATPTTTTTTPATHGRRRSCRVANCTRRHYHVFSFHFGMMGGLLALLLACFSL